MKEANITFIGCGNMGSSLITGLIKNAYPKDCLHVADADPEKRKRAETEFDIQVYADNLQAIDNADVVVLATKPQALMETIDPLAEVIKEKQPLIISIAAGIAISSISHSLGETCAIIRVMPNTPALIQAGASGLYANEYVSDEQKQLAETILKAVGVTVWLDNEALIDAVTAISGSGPAYYFLLMEAMMKTAMSLGLNEEQAKTLTLQTALGAGLMAKDSDEAVSLLRQRVTSPGGTTEAALNSFAAQGFEEIVQKALFSARDRAIELGKIVTKETNT